MPPSMRRTLGDDQPLCKGERENAALLGVEREVPRQQHVCAPLLDVEVVLLLQILRKARKLHTQQTIQRQASALRGATHRTETSIFNSKKNQNKARGETHIAVPVCINKRVLGHRPAREDAALGPDLQLPSGCQRFVHTCIDRSDQNVKQAGIRVQFVTELYQEISRFQNFHFWTKNTNH